MTEDSLQESQQDGVPSASPVGVADGMDHAQQSLADAMRFLLRCIQVVMVALVIGFLLTGCRTIEEGERAISLRFGQVQQANIKPGATWVWPFPIGDVVRVDTSAKQLDLRDAFWFHVPPERRGQPIPDRGSPWITIGKDGALLTADGEFVHARWIVRYEVVEPAEYARTVDGPAAEAAIVRVAVSRGVVQAVASTSTDQFLGLAQGTEGTETGSSVERRAAAIAQRTLEALDAGVTIHAISLIKKTPPPNIRLTFSGAAKSQEEAGKAVVEARRDAHAKLVKTAGLAYERLLSLIDRYELALAGVGDEEPEAVLAAIDAAIDGSDIGTNSNARGVTGEVATLMNNARRYRTDIVSYCESMAGTFKANLASYRESREVFIATEWTDAYRLFLLRANPEIFSIAAGQSPKILLNRDPEIVKEQVRARNSRQTKKALNTVKRRFLERQRGVDLGLEEEPEIVN